MHSQQILQQTEKQYNIDQEFKPIFGDPKTQKDFVKQIKVYKDVDLLLSFSENFQLNIFDLSNNELNLSLETKMGNPIYDIELFQNKHYSNNLLLSIKDQPLSLYNINETENNCFELKLRGQISDIKPMSEFYWAPLEMKQINNQILAAGRGFLRQYDINTLKVSQFIKCTKKDAYCSLDVQQNAQNPLVCVGKFNNIAEIYDRNNLNQIAKLETHVGGVTSVKFNEQDLNQLFTGARKDNLIYQWDIRKLSNFVQYFERPSNTNQRQNFDILDNQLVAGQADGSIAFFDINDKSKKVVQNNCHDDLINHVLFYQSKTKQNSTYLISSSGQRRFQLLQNKVIQKQQQQLQQQKAKNEGKNQTNIEIETENQIQQNEEIEKESSSDWSSDEVSESDEEQNGLFSISQNRQNSIKMWNFNYQSQKLEHQQQL